MKVLEALASGIAAEGIDRIFGVIGDANQEIIVELCEKHGLKFVHTHHETAAVGMADGYARLSGKIGLASTTQGPGYTNATTSLVSARLHRSPVLMLAGHASLRDPYNPQGMLDQHAMAKLTTGATVKIDHAHNVDYCLGEAFRQLKANKGPFVLNMPQDVLHAVLPDEKWTYRPMYKAKVLQPPRPEDVAEAAKILANAKRPTLLCGLGAAEGKAEPEVRKLAEFLGAPVATSLYAAGFCAQYPLYLGISGGLGSDLTVDILAESDAMIVVGASLNEWTTHFGKILENGKKIIQIDDREDAFGWFARISVGLEADAKAAVPALLDQLQQGGKPARQPDAATFCIEGQRVEHTLFRCDHPELPVLRDHGDPVAREVDRGGLPRWRRRRTAASTLAVNRDRRGEEQRRGQDGKHSHLPITQLPNYQITRLPDC